MTKPFFFEEAPEFGLQATEDSIKKDPAFDKLQEYAGMAFALAAKTGTAPEEKVMAEADIIMKAGSCMIRPYPCLIRKLCNRS